MGAGPPVGEVTPVTTFGKRSSPERLAVVPIGLDNDLVQSQRSIRVEVRAGRRRAFAAEGSGLVEVEHDP